LFITYVIVLGALRLRDFEGFYICATETFARLLGIHLRDS